MKPEYIFLVVWLVFAVTIITFFIVTGKKLLSKYPKLDKSSFEFIENGASGYSTKSFKSRMAGAHNVLQIRVTKDELWIKSNLFMAFSLNFYDLLKIIPIKSILSVETKGKREIMIECEKGSKLVIKSKKRDKLMKLLIEKNNKLKTN